MQAAGTTPEDETLLTALRTEVIRRHGSLRGYLAHEVRAAIHAHVRSMTTATKNTLEGTGDA